MSVDAFVELKQLRLPNWGRYRKAQWSRCGPAQSGAMTHIYGMGRDYRDGNVDEDERTIRIELAQTPPPDVDEPDAVVIDGCMVGLVPEQRAVLSAVFVWGRHHDPRVRDLAIRAVARLLPRELVAA